MIYFVLYLLLTAGCGDYGCFQFNVLLSPPSGHMKRPHSNTAGSASLILRYSACAQNNQCTMFPLYFSGEEEALTLAVGGWDALQLKEVEEDLNLGTQNRRSEPKKVKHFSV